MGLRIKFKFKPGHLDFIPREHDKIKSIFWNLTNECTHNCIFCYASGGILKENEFYCGNIREKDLEEILENEILDNFRKRE
jgi:MoaA/NifB/PqqE/SkfB family radical SAM enzyme